MICEEGLPATVLQPTHVYGPFGGYWTERQVEMFLSGPVVLPAPDDGICNAVYVDDVVHALSLAAVRDEAVGETFLISGVESTTWSEFYRQYARAVGRADGLRLYSRKKIRAREDDEPSRVAQGAAAFRSAASPPADAPWFAQAFGAREFVSDRTPRAPWGQDRATVARGAALRRTHWRAGNPAERRRPPPVRFTVRGADRQGPTPARLRAGVQFGAWNGIDDSLRSVGARPPVSGPGNPRSRPTHNGCREPPDPTFLSHHGSKKSGRRRLRTMKRFLRGTGCVV